MTLHRFSKWDEVYNIQLPCVELEFHGKDLIRFMKQMMGIFGFSCNSGDKNQLGFLQIY